jgi:hypothetical protein
MYRINPNKFNNLSCVSLLCMLLFAIDLFLCKKNFISELLHIYWVNKREREREQKIAHISRLGTG